MGMTPVEAYNEDQGKYGQAKTFDPSFKGPIKDRGCTDILCLLILLAFLGGWIFIAVMAFSWGDPMILLYPSNSDGQICGQKNDKVDLTNKTSLLFFDITKCLSTSAITGCRTREVCVEKCPDINFKPDADSTSDADKAKMRPYCGPDFDESKTLSQMMKQQICPDWVVQSKPLLGRCVPSVNKTTVPDFLEFDTLKKGVEALAKFMDVRSIAEKVLDDLQNTWWMVLVGLVLACAVALVWVVLMRSVRFWSIYVHN